MDQDDRFQCPTCEFLCDRQHVSYDELGYPICPTCGANAGPKGKWTAQTA